MYIDRDYAVEEFPFRGEFYYVAETPSEDGDLLKQPDVTEVVVLDTKCDIQRKSQSDSDGVILGGYNVYFPFTWERGGEQLPVKYGYSFRSTDYPDEVCGRVESLEYSQLGAYTAFIKVGSTGDHDNASGYEQGA